MPASPVAPMLARLERELPRGGYVYEPKWDGFRCLAACDRDEVHLRSRSQRPLSRYFPELVAALRALPTTRFLLDGEIVARAQDQPDFTALLARRRALPSSLLLGLYDDGELRHMGIASSFAAAARERLLEELAPHVVPLAGHPWEHGFLLGGSPIGRLPGAAGRWTPGEMVQDWVPVAPVLVCEVQFDQLEDHRFRHPARFRRWRPDRHSRSCTLEQLA